MPDTLPRQGDSGVRLLRKLVLAFGGDADEFGSDLRLLRKLVTLAGGEPSQFDSRTVLTRKLARAAGAQVDEFDSATRNLRKWADQIGATTKDGGTALEYLRAALMTQQPVVPAWNPGDEAGLLGWWSADVGVTDVAGAVTTWADRSGNGRTMTAPADANRPALIPGGLGALPTIQFNGTSHWMKTGSFVVSQPFTLYLLAKQVGYTQFDRVIGGAGASDFFVYQSNTVAPNVSMRTGGSVGPTFTAWAVGDFAVLQMHWSGVNSKARRNLNTEVGGNPGTLGFDGLSLGASNLGALFGNIEFVEVIARSGLDDVLTGFRHYTYLAHRASFAVRNMLNEGDSLTQGAGVALANLFPHKVLAGKSPVAWGYNNVAVGGSTVAQMAARATSADEFSDRLADENWITVWCGTNDIVNGATAEQVVAGLVSYCQARRQAGFKVLVFTILPRTAISGAKETERQELNTIIRATWVTFADGLADVAADATLGAENANLNTTYYSDGTHLTAAGHTIVAAIVTAALP